MPLLGCAPDLIHRSGKPRDTAEISHLYHRYFCFLTELYPRYFHHSPLSEFHTSLQILILFGTTASCPLVHPVNVLPLSSPASSLLSIPAAGLYKHQSNRSSLICNLKIETSLWKTLICDIAWKVISHPAGALKPSLRTEPEQEQFLIAQDRGQREPKHSKMQ